MQSVRRSIEQQVHALVGGGSSSHAIDLDRPAGDPGLFGPRSVCWRVHGDFTSMMAGGLAALLLQMLHPAALAGVWDHSNFREDRLGRLRRTAQFIAGTTYGSTALATDLIARVRLVHDRVAGTLPDGTPYAANDPALLTWVHVAEVSSFLAAHLHYRDAALTGAEQDAYYAETARVAVMLGAEHVPTSRRAVAAYLRDMRPQLGHDQRTREVTAILLDPQRPGPAIAMFGSLVRTAGIDLLPGWAAAMHGFTPSSAARPAVRAGTRAMGGLLRWAMRDGSASRARRRAG